MSTTHAKCAPFYDHLGIENAPVPAMSRSHLREVNPSGSFRYITEKPRPLPWITSSWS